MKTEEQIKKRIREIEKMLSDEENQGQFMQIKLWNSLDLLNWILKD